MQTFENNIKALGKGNCLFIKKKYGGRYLIFFLICIFDLKV